jgi:alpha-1,6-mannosyltransferase
MIAFAASLLALQVGMLALAPRLVERAEIPFAPVLGFVALAMLGGALWFWAIPGLLARMPWPAWLALGAAMRLLWLDAPVVLNTDHFRYLWDGALVAHGLWPWGAPPAAGVPEALGEAGAALRDQLRFAGLRSIYPGTAQAGFGLAHLLLPWDMRGLRLLALAAEAATLALSLLWLRGAGWPASRAAIWWCCPLVPVLLLGNAHVDVLLPPLLLGGRLAARAGRGWATGALLGLAVGVKLWPVLLAPLLGRALPPAAWPGAALALLLVGGVMAAPLLATIGTADAGLAAYAGGWLVNNAPFAWAVALWPGAGAWLRPLVALAAGGVALAVAWRAPSGPAVLVGGTMVIAASVFYLSPAQYPWYGVWFMPFATLLAFRPLLLPAVLLPLYWLWFPMDRAGQGALFNLTLAALHALPVALALLLWRRR